jgi:hypothetical protein
VAEQCNHSFCLGLWRGAQQQAPHIEDCTARRNNTCKATCRVGFFSTMSGSNRPQSAACKAVTPARDRT